jgi:hypothetical protein
MLPGGPFCFGLVGVILFLMGLKTGWGALKDWRQYRESEGWIPVVGLVTASNVNELPGDENSTSTYEPIITYTYQVMGKSYEGSQISFGSKGVTYGSHKKAEKVVARYPAGSQPAIHYDPADPSLAVLERKFNTANTIFGSIVLLVGAWMLYLVYIQ